MGEAAKLLNDGPVLFGKAELLRRAEIGEQLDRASLHREILAVLERHIKKLALACAKPPVKPDGDCRL